jgi:Domain of unknown function (DUF5666)
MRGKEPSDMKKRLAILALVAVVTLVAVAPALASGPRQGRGQVFEEQKQMGKPPSQQLFTLVGTITAIDGGAITIQVRSGNRPVRPYVGQELTVQLTENTRYRQWTPNGCVPIDLVDVSVGDTVSVQGVVGDDTFVARRVTIDVPLNCCTS